MWIWVTAFHFFTDFMEVEEKEKNFKGKE